MRVLLPLLSFFAIQVSSFKYNVTSEGLKQASEMLRGSLNESVNPCNDFFDFTCSRWISENSIPNDRSYYDR
jgi:predicted metalloendopeptidase